MWIDTEALRDCIAGPLFSVVTRGNCSYVYGREDSYFKGVSDPIGLKSRLLEALDELVEAIDQFAPKTANELSDQESMHQNASDIWSAVETAIEIELLRHVNADLG